MPRRESLHHPLCICCETNRVPNKKQIFCIHCSKFIHGRLEMDGSKISRKIGQAYYARSSTKCNFCEKKAVYSYKNYENKKKYYICKKHHDRWLHIGCQLGELANFLHVEE